MIKWTERYPADIPLMCQLFGHKWEGGWYGSYPYLEAKQGAVDGIGRHHIQLYCKCDRCGNKYHIASIHEHAVKEVFQKPEDDGRIWNG